MNNKDKIYIVIFNILLYAIISLFMYDFYKALSGLIANNFYEAHIMLTIILSYLLPVFYYLFFFYDKYCKRQSNKVRFIFDIIFIIYCLYNIISIFSHINIYISNSNLGVYDSMPSLFLSFPFDMLVVNCLILFISIISLVNIFKPNEKISNIRNVFSEYGFISLKKYEYALISILAILCFVFFGDFLNSFKAIENLFYDPKYLYLMLWVLIVPLSTITYFVLKLDRYFSTKKIINNLSSNIYFNSHNFYPFVSDI